MAAGKGPDLRKGANLPAYWENYDLAFGKKKETVTDGFGNEWQKCDKKDCKLHVVRPGKVQCWCDDVLDNEETLEDS